MPYLQRSKVRPELDDLTSAEARTVRNTFDPYAGEVIVEGQSIGWNEIEEVEVAVAARAGGPAGWVVRYLVHGDQRYHVGLYFGQDEAVLRNVTLNIAKYVVQTVAFYAPQSVRYTGPADLVPLTDKP
jgi:hypothetical protein